LEELKQLLAHQNFEGKMDVLIKQVAAIALKKLKPSQESGPTQAQQVSEEVASEETELTSAPEMRKRSRYIPAQERRKVLQRDQSGCTYKDPKSGRVCGSRHGLQFDHIVPFSQGGAHTAQNLTLLCGAHNRFRAEQSLNTTRSLKVRQPNFRLA
jgi:hypothetical protein